jgi:hypothetical protein
VIPQEELERAIARWKARKNGEALPEDGADFHEEKTAQRRGPPLGVHEEATAMYPDGIPPDPDGAPEYVAHAESDVMEIGDEDFDKG